MRIQERKKTKHNLLFVIEWFWWILKCILLLGMWMYCVIITYEIIARYMIDIWCKSLCCNNTMFSVKICYWMEKLFTFKWFVWNCANVFWSLVEYDIAEIWWVVAGANGQLYFIFGLFSIHLILCKTVWAE